MKKIILCVLAVLFISIFSFEAKAEEIRVVNFDWKYTPPIGLKVTGFNLYQDGVKITQLIGADLNHSSMVCILKAQKTIFTLAAVFTDGSESYSMPAVLNLANSKPAKPKNFKLISQKEKINKSSVNLKVATISFVKKG